ncbi:helix-turn-helix domain-containing protein [Metapseudomonas furukawaii]|uniref:DNA-binding protein n=1 Tax=Metapseudomonas furukawaii TaxID=1149133 RepID=UPI00227C5ABB|nr:DNA-binding protein [Pseudomonas furukawaii]WAG77884.1 helix-turn-helix domain-containing protein [Pseudomonas furukawaii]
MNGPHVRLTRAALPSSGNSAAMSAEAFADMCGVSVETVTGWMDNGTVPAVRVQGSRLIDLELLCEDLEQGKDAFDKGDYEHA